MPMRSFSLNSREFHETYCRREYSELPRDTLWPREPDYVSVMAETEADAQHAVKAWLEHVEAGTDWAQEPRAKA